MYNFSIFIKKDNVDIPFLCESKTLSDALTKAKSCLGLSEQPTNYSIKYIQEVKSNG